jgi:hypothetical protein
VRFVSLMFHFYCFCAVSSRFTLYLFRLVFLVGFSVPTELFFVVLFFLGCVRRYGFFVFFSVFTGDPICKPMMG